MSDRTIRCSEILDKVGPYVDGELESAERGRVEAHLDVCGPCAEVAAEIREIDLSASRIPVPEITAGEWRGVWARVEAEGRGARIVHAPNRLLRWALPAAAAVLIGSVFLGSWFPKAPVNDRRVEEQAERIKPETISGPAPNSIDLIEGVGEEDPASFVQYSDF
jgi:anti-sigma factor RsiW